jgi:low affinity Fe/Cu permease
MKKKKSGFFERIATAITSWTGSSLAFGIALGIVLGWVASGPLFGYSDTWQLVINTGTTIITFLMVFLIQKSQNKDSKAIQLKLNELIAASRFTSNRMVDIEDLDEEELADMAEEEENIHESHSIDAARRLQEEKNEWKEKNQ